MNNREIEVRFLEVDVTAILNRLVKLGSQDSGEELIREVIFYDKEGRWLTSADRKYLRLRQDRAGIKLTFKRLLELTPSGTLEIEMGVDDWAKSIDLLEQLGFISGRSQEKRRHRFILNDVEVDLVKWPLVPTLLEIEGQTEDDLKKTAISLGLDWGQVQVWDNMWLLENKYNIPIKTYKYFTFNKQE